MQWPHSGEDYEMPTVDDKGVTQFCPICEETARKREKYKKCNHTHALKLLQDVGLNPKHHSTIEAAAYGVSQIVKGLRENLADPDHALCCAVLKKMKVKGYCEKPVLKFKGVLGKKACPICEHNAGNVESEFRMNGPFAAKIARLLSALKMKMEYESEERKSATQIVLIDRICWDALKEWQPKKRGEV